MTFATKISLITLDKSHETLIANKGCWIKEIINKYNFIFWLHCIRIVTCDYDTTILVTIEANDVLPHILILNYLKYNNNYYFEIIYDVQFKCLDDIILWYVLQPYFESVWGWDSHSRNGDLGVLWDSQNFRAWLERSKHLALKCSS